MIHRHVPSAEQARLFGRELSYILPREDVDKFSDLFSSIESEINNKNGGLGISSYGVSMTTLEEIFLHLGEEEEAAKEIAALEQMQPGKKRGVRRVCILS
jgi:ATP-binding cassette subfamily A (ABC1) protein 5